MKTRIGLVGHGMWGRNILRDLLALGCEVVVADSCNEQRSLANKNGAAGAVRSTDALPEVQGVIVATPATTHATLLESLLDANGLYRLL